MDPRSDVLFGSKIFTKDEQELAVAEYFLGLYALHVVPSTIQHGPGKPTPPDWIFRFPQCAVAVEMTEVDQQYSLRFQEQAFTNHIYTASVRQALTSISTGFGLVPFGRRMSW
jgi:hypothetical protein